MQKTLYLGLELPPHLQANKVVHCPFIRIVPKSASDPAIISALKNFADYTHLIFTSKNAVTTFFNLAQKFSITIDAIRPKTIISVGQRTAAKLKENGVRVDKIAFEETAEGITKILNPEELKCAHVLLPQSSLARLVLANWFNKHGILYTACPIYDTLSNIPNVLPDLKLFDQIIFTSPSVIDAFIQAYGSLPMEKTLLPIGPVTKRHLNDIKNRATHVECV